MNRRIRTILSALVVTIAMATGASAQMPPMMGASTSYVQTNLVTSMKSLKAKVHDKNLLNPWGLVQGPTPFWISDNNAGVSTLYQVPDATNGPVINPLVVNIPTPAGSTGGTPTGTVFNTASSSGPFQITGPDKSGHTASAPAVFLFVTEDGSIVGWNPGIDPSGQFAGPAGASTDAAIAVDNSGNNFTNPDPRQQTGAVYKGLAIATSATPIIAGDADSTALLYVTNFRAGTVEVYDAQFSEVTALQAGAFSDPDLPPHYAPFNVQVLNGKV